MHDYGKKILSYGLHGEELPNKNTLEMLKKISRAIAIRRPRMLSSPIDLQSGEFNPQ